MNIGIDKNYGTVYEASTQHGHTISPSPTLILVSIAEANQEIYSPAKTIEPDGLLFREDTYNTSSRIRRGRLYQADSSQPGNWFIENQNGQHIQTSVNSFHPLRIFGYIKRNNIDDPVFLLGKEGGFTIWTLINVEISATGDELITLRARKSIGALPNIDKEQIEPKFRKAVQARIDHLEKDVFNAGPESVIDRSREAATAILSSFLQIKGLAKPGKDLNDLANIALKEKLVIVANLAHTIARLHARAKHAVQEEFSPRSVTEQDAELAVQAVGTILCDLGWGNWGLFD